MNATLVAHIRRHSALRYLFWRALLVYAPLRILLAFLSAAGDGGGLSPDNPAGIVALMILLALIDTRVRGDRLLWANLGYGRLLIAGVFAATACVGEALIALVRA